MLLHTALGEWVPLSVRTPWANTITGEIRDRVRDIIPAERCRLVQLVEAWMVNVQSAGLLPAERVSAESNQAVA